jgi:hypothetical protein
MPTAQVYTAPGVYIAETQSVTHQVVGATTNLTAVMGVFDQGPVNEAVLVGTWDEFEDRFGGLNGTMASYAVWQFFHNGGIGAWIVRLTLEAETDSATVGTGTVKLADRTPGASGWSAQLTTPANPPTPAPATLQLDYTLTETEGGKQVESFPNLDASSAAKLAQAIQSKSGKVNATPAATTTAPAADTAAEPLTGGVSGDAPAQAQVGSLALAGSSPGQFMNGWTVELKPTGGSPQQPANHVTLTITDATTPTPTPTVVEVVPNLPTGTPGDAADLQTLADLISSKSSYVQATPAAVAVSAATPTAAVDFAGGVDANLTTSITGANASADLGDGLVLFAAEPGVAQNSWTAELSADPTNAELLQLVISGPTPTETLGSLPTDLQALAIAITSRSQSVTAPLTAPLENGADADWTATAFTEAVLAELGFSTAPGPAPVPRLDQIAPDHFNLMCIPDAAWLPQGNQTAIFSSALEFCQDRQAFLIVDPPPPAAAPVPSFLPDTVPWLQIEKGIGASPGDMQALLGAWAPAFTGDDNWSAAAYYPWLEIPDPANNFLPIAVPPSGTVAGIYATTDVDRGVWKAPAGVGNPLRGLGVPGLADTSITNEVNGQLNEIGVNCLRTFPIVQNVVWGSRTLAGADLLQTAFKYVPARRLANYIELSLQQSLLWTVFEPNEESLWSSIVAEITPFMAGLFASGAFMGSTATQAYTVACDATTTSTADMLRGVVNIQVGFQPVDPAEFVVLNVQVGALTAAAS